MSTRVLGVLFVVVLALSIPSSASAHPIRQYHGSDYADVGSNHRSLTVCDRESDGNGFFGQFVNQNGQSYYLTDTNGSASPCASDYYGGASPLINFRLCEQTSQWTSSCGAWWGIS